MSGMIRSNKHGQIEAFVEADVENLFKKGILERSFEDWGGAPVGVGCDAVNVG